MLFLKVTILIMLKVDAALELFEDKGLNVVFLTKNVGIWAVFESFFEATV